MTCSRAAVLRLGVRASRDLRSSTSGQLPSSGPIAYLPPLARSFSHLWWSPHLFPRRFFSVRTATTTNPELARRLRASAANYYQELKLRLAPSVRAAGPEPFFRKTGVTEPRGGLVPPPFIAPLHHQHACASSTDAWVLLRQRCLDRRRCDTPHPPAVERHVCHRVGAYQPNRSEDDH